jgi:periplasmic protein TonB
MHRSIHLSRTLWLCAALGALAVHAGGAALALGYLRTADSDVDLGAPAIEIGVELASPKLDPSELPVGPDTEASAAVPAVVEQKAVTEQNELPKATPEETDDPDRVVSPADSQKPKDDDPKVATIQAQPSEQSLATEATAPPTVDGAREAPQSVAPAQGTGASTQRVRATWQKELAAHFNKYKRYPADRAAQGAEVVVSFALDRGGHVLSTSIVKGSGDASFDAEALAMLARSDPVPAPPPVVADEGLTFTLPVIFQVKKQN